MTILIGASVLLIAGSAVALVFGWTGADQSLIWTSIAATAGAAVTLALAYFRSRSEAAPSRARAGGATTTSAATAEPGARSAPAEEATTPAAEAEQAETTSEEDRAEDVAAEDAEPAPTQEVPAVAPARSKPTVSRLEVVAVPSTKKFHRPDCRYASSSGAEKMTKGSARKQGYAPCGVCKP
ncbi:MAG TPA: hypothetical protein VIG64_08140 [Actinomycetota bacterium]|jgi:hypothetical protein